MLKAGYLHRNGLRHSGNSTAARDRHVRCRQPAQDWRAGPRGISKHDDVLRVRVLRRFHCGGGEITGANTSGLGERGVFVEISSELGCRGKEKNENR